MKTIIIWATFMLAVLVGLWLLAEHIVTTRCHTQARDTGLESRWTYSVLCQVRVNERWVPLEQVYFVPNTTVPTVVY